MKNWKIILLITIFLYSCNNSNDSEVVKNQFKEDTTKITNLINEINTPCLEYYPGNTFDSRDEKLLPRGDYNGDKIQDTLIAKIELLNDNKDTTFILETGEDLFTLQNWTYQTPHNLLIRSINKIKPLRLKNKTYLSGLAFVCNVGEVNNKPGDELAMVFFTPDFSNLNTMFLFSYVNEKWTVLSEWNVRENDLSGETHVQPFDSNQVMVRTLDFEAEMHDTIISIQYPYLKTHFFEIK